MNDIICRSCGRKVPAKANFCRFCGTKIEDHQVEEQKRETTSSLYSKSVLSSNRAVQKEYISESKKEKEIEIPPLDEEEIKILYGKKRKNSIKKEKNTLLSEMEELEQKFKIGVISSAEFENKLAKLDKKINDLKNEEQELKSGSIPVEQMILDYNESLDKLEKIDKMRKNNQITSEKVYKKLKGEYKDKKDGLEKQLVFEKKKINSWISTIDKKIETIEDDIQALNAKLSLGDITRDAAAEKEQDYVNKKRTYSVALEEYKIILREIPI